jgi:DNA-binding SARP family transcriptional activator
MLQVTLLGEQLVGDARGAVRARSARSVALLAHLALHAGVPQSRQRIAARFWPDSADEQALTNLRRELHHLRGVLGADPSLVVTNRDLCWRDSPTCLVDVRAFALDRAAALAAAARGDTGEFLARAGAAADRYGGEFLPGVDADWAAEARGRLEQECVDLLDRLVRARSAGGDPAGALDAARRRLRLRPLEEAGYRALMECQGDAGDRAGAVRTYHQCAAVLERELGVEPDPATRASLNRLLARAAPPTTPAPRRGQAAGLVGRDGELHVLRECWRRSVGGRPGLVLVRGDAGVGKSRLMDELGEEVRRAGAIVAGAQCFGTAGRLALAPVADWLRVPEIQAARGTLEPVWRAEVERLVPAARGRGEQAAPPHAMVDAWQQHRFFEGLTRAVTGTGRPVLLTVDNLHWCDPETLAFVTFCLGLVPDAPLLVVATLRDEPADQEPGLAPWIVRMRATGLLREVALGPFDEADTRTLGEAVAGRRFSETEAATLAAATGGYPLHIVEAARGGGPDGEGELSRVLVQRLRQAGPEASEIAGLAAAVGRDFTLDLLTEAADLDADAVVRAIDELWRRRILHAVGDGYDFTHDLLRDAAYAQVSPPRRWLLHRRLAQGMELLHGEDTDAVSAQLAEQHARGGQGRRAIGYYRRAAQIAASRFAHGEANRLHEAALAIVRTLPEGRNRLIQELEVLEADAAPLNARFGYASTRLRETLERAITLAEALGRRDALLGGLVSLWTSQFVHGDIAVAHRTAERAFALLEPGSPLTGQVHFARGGSAINLGRMAEAVQHFLLAAEHGGSHPLTIGTRVDIHGRAWGSHAQWLLGRDAEALAGATEAVAMARATGNRYSLAVALSYVALVHQFRDDLPPLREAAGELRELCERDGYAYYREWGLILDGWSRTDGTGRELVRRGVDGLVTDGAFTRMPYWLSLSADIDAREGRTDAARATLDAALSAGRARGDVWWLPEVLRRRAAHEEGPRAVALLRQGMDLAREHGSLALVARCARDLEALGDVAFAVPQPAEAAAARANGTGTPRS